MNKFEPTPNHNSGDDSPSTTRGNDPTRGETTHRQTRTRAPQFGTDRRNQRDMESRPPKSARHQGDANGVPPQSGGQLPERRVARQDRRQSYS